MVDAFDCELPQAAEQLAVLLAGQKLRIVFAESCTAGLVSAVFASVPGISQWFCGSAVTYRETTKTTWLSVSPEMIDECNVVSAEVAQAMAEGVLQLTPEADVAAAITGHLGPDAPPALDGVVYIAVAQRDDDARSPRCERLELKFKERLTRQKEAALAVLRYAAQSLS